MQAFDGVEFSRMQLNSVELNFSLIQWLMIWFRAVERIIKKEKEKKRKEVEKKEKRDEKEREKEREKGWGEGGTEEVAG
jgi:hypothetical protein